MSVNSTDAFSGPYTATGATQSFPFTFNAASRDEIELTADGVTIDPATYSVTLNSDGTGTVNATLTAGAEVFVESNPDFQQPAQFSRFAPYFPDAINVHLDRSAIRDIALADRVARTVVRPRLYQDFVGKIPTLDDAGNWQLIDGQPGPAGPAAAFRANLLALKAAATSDGQSVYDGALWIWTPGNFSATPASDLDVNIVKANSTALTAGAWVRQRASNVAFLGAGSGAVRRTLEDKARDRLSVRDYGALGVVVANDTQAFKDANLIAEAAGKDLDLPAGTYMIDAEMEAKSSWFGEKGTRVRYRGTAPSFTRLVYATGRDGIVFENIIFDGNVSADPTAWTNANHDAFTGASGLSVENCANPIVRNCRGENTRQHGFRFINCVNPLWDRCVTKRSRGAFGDGFIALSNVRVRALFCDAEDGTRIGFVLDSLGDNLQTTYKNVMVGCAARNFHDASVAYGGGEFNAGFWHEHAADTVMVNCVSDDTTHRGINFCTGSANNGLVGGVATLTMIGCDVSNTIFGIQTYSLGGVPLRATMIGCNTKRTRIGFEADAATGQDVYRWIGCHADYDASSGTARGFATQPVGTLTGKPLFETLDCTVSRWAETQSNLDDSGDLAATADVGSYSLQGEVTTATRVVVRNLRHVDSSKPVYLRVYGSYAHDIDISGCDFIMRRGGSSGGTIRINGNTIRALSLNYNGYAAIAHIYGNVVRGRVTVMGNVIRCYANDLRHIDESDLWLLSNATGKRPSVTVRGNDFSKPLNTFGATLRLGDGDATTPGTQPFTAIVSGNLFYNDGPSSAAQPFVTRGVATTVYFDANLVDDTAVNMIAITGTLAAPEVTPTGIRKVSLH